MPRPISRGLCKIEDCGRPHSALGYCGRHYARFKRYGDPHGYTPRVRRNRRCEVENCGLAHYGLGYCTRHYRRFKTHGDPLGRRKRQLRQPLRICKVEGCSKVVKGWGYCSTHYQRVKRHGDPNVATRRVLTGPTPRGRLVRGVTGKGRWWILVWFTQEERILELAELDALLARFRRDRPDP
jgi:hypothetical protein